MRGAGVTWTLVKRSNTQHGVAEIWTARGEGHAQPSGPSPPHRRAPATRAQLTVIAFRNAKGTGVAGAAGGPRRASRRSTCRPSGPASWVFATGNDWDGAVARRPVAGSGPATAVARHRPRRHVLGPVDHGADHHRGSGHDHRRSAHHQPLEPRSGGDPGGQRLTGLRPPQVAVQPRLMASTQTVIARISASSWPGLDLDAVGLADPEPLLRDLGDGVAVALDLVLVVDDVARAPSGRRRRRRRSRSGPGCRPAPCGPSRRRRAALDRDLVAHAELALLDLGHLVAGGVLEHEGVAHPERLAVDLERVVARARPRSSSRRRSTAASRASGSGWARVGIGPPTVSRCHVRGPSVGGDVHLESTPSSLYNTNSIITKTKINK